MAEELTPEAVRTYSDKLISEWGGLEVIPPAVVCPRCGAFIQGSDSNIELHLKWHRTAERDILAGLF